MKQKRYRSFWLILIIISLVLFLSGCEQMVVFDPVGPVGQKQKDLIVYSLWFMLGIVIVVFGLFAYIIIKYRARLGRGDKDYDPNIHGNTLIEVIWTVVPLLIVTALSIPTVETIYDLESPAAATSSSENPSETLEQEPLVIYATSADWKWFFSYPEQGIETVNYLHIPTDRAIEFRLSSADSMASLWIPALGGQKYGMAGMMNKLYLQADEVGVYNGRNSNFTGEGFTEQTFKVYAESEDKFNAWVDETKDKAPALTQKKYDSLLKPGLVDPMEFSSTHLQWVNHGTMEGADYSIKRHRDAYKEKIHLDAEKAELPY